MTGDAAFLRNVLLLPASIAAILAVAVIVVSALGSRS